MTDACQTDAAAHTTPELVIITGMSGAGRSEAVHTFEDLGYFCIDNLPPSFLPQLVELAELPGSPMRRLAVVCDVRAHEFLDELTDVLDELSRRGLLSRLLYLEASDATLLTRFKESRRPHPMCEEGAVTMADAIVAERTELEGLRGAADVVIDTTGLRPQELRMRIRKEFGDDHLEEALTVSVASFGFKYGTPTDADIVMDVRFLPNPYYDPILRPQTGLDGPVRAFVLERRETIEFLRSWFALLDTVMPGYVAEGKHHLGIAIGCTGGMHRSVALAEATADHLRHAGYRVAVSHRDMGRDLEGR